LMLTFENSIYISLLLVGGLLMLYQFKLMFFPQAKGEIVGFESMFPEGEDCKACRSKKLRGKMSLGVRIRTDDGREVDAEISHCTVCLEKLDKGSRVGITKIGSRTVAVAAWNARKRGVFKLFRGDAS